MTFRNSVVGGDTLVRAAIQSPNFVTGVSGWTIKRDGSAEFNNVTIRGGTVISGTSLYYNGTPALGNLFMSISATSGTDSFGNAYVKGAGLYGSVGTLTAKDTTGNTTIVTGALPVNGLLASLPGISMDPVSNTGDPASIGALDPGGGGDLGLILTSPSPNTNGVPGTDFAQIYMTGPYASPAPSITMVADAAGGTINLNTVTIDDGGSIAMLGGEVVNVGASASTAVFASLASATTVDLLSARITGDTTNSRFVINHAGQHLWGPGGGTAVDTNLYRSAANTLKTDDSLVVAVDLTVDGIINASPAAGTGAQAIVFNEGYSMYADNTGAGSSNDRFWLDGPDGGEAIIGPRTGANFFDSIRLRTDATTASAANCFIDSSSQKISRSTSSLKYKQDVENYTFDLDAVRALRPVRFHDKGEMASDPENARWYVGLIAEEVDALGLTEFVAYLDGEPDALMYDRMCIALLQLVKNLEERIAVLENA